MKVAVTAVGLETALGRDPWAVDAAVRAGDSGVRPRPDTDFSRLADSRAALVDDLSFRKLLVRRKDAKLLARASQLVLPAAAAALQGYDGETTALGLFLAVGREPPDDGESEAALVASHRDGHLDPTLLAGPGRDRYPPLLPLRTLPNMALAHISINFDICGTNGAWAGGPEAGGAALSAALWAVAEGRAPAALVGGADCLAHVALQRDRQRMGEVDPPGEGAALLRIERGAKAPLAWLQLGADPAVAAYPDIRPALGACGAAEDMIRLVLAIAGETRPTRVGDILVTS